MPSSKAMWLVECSRFPPTTFVIVANQKCQLYLFVIPPAGELQLTKLFYKNKFFVLYTN